MKAWNTGLAIELCKRIEGMCPKFGCHVALTGGLLYREGERKDCDLIFYRIRQKDLDLKGLLAALETYGLTFVEQKGWCYKFTHDGRSVDVLIPELNHIKAPKKKPEETYEAAA